MNRRRLMKSGGIPEGAVDLGLPSGTLWAQGNIVKNGDKYEIGELTAYGAYFSWGNIEPHFSTNGSTFDDGYNFNTNTYKSTPGYTIAFTKDGDSFAEDSGHDAARELLGGKWKMPTMADFKELDDNCTSVWVTNYNGSGVNGRLFTSKINGATLFFPATGIASNTHVYEYNYEGDYWSRLMKDYYSSYLLFFYDLHMDTNVNSVRNNGLSVRAVYDVTKTADVIQDGDGGGDEGEDTVISTFLREYVLRITGVTKSSKTGYRDTRTSYNGFTSYTYKCPSGNYRPSWSVSFEKRIDSYDKYSSGKEVLTDSLTVLDSTHYYECNLSVNRYTDGTVKISQGSINLADNQTSTWGENIIHLNLEGGNGSYTGSDTNLNTIIYNVNVSYDGSSSTADVRIYSDNSFEITLYP